MNTPTKLGGFAAALAAVFGVAIAVGNAVGPLGSAVKPTSHGDKHTGGHDEGRTADHSAGDAHGGHKSGQAGTSSADTQPGGLLVSAHGYTLALDQRSLPAGNDVPVTFRVLGPDGEPVTDYELTHDKDLHFIAVRRDLAGFQHVHPTRRAGAGNWGTKLDLTPGTWRFFADFHPAEHGETMTLGADAFVAGPFEPRTFPTPTRTATVGDYTVTLDGDLAPGQASKVTLSVRRDGEPVTDLEPYLASYGHLVALRVGDLAYLHVHPAGTPGDDATEPGPDITFYVTAPTTGEYRLFLDFKHQGVVRTAEFAVDAARGGAR